MFLLAILLIIWMKEVYLVSYPEISVSLMMETQWDKLV